MDSRATIIFVILLSAMMGSATTKDENPQHNETNIAEFIKSSCNMTQYPQLCISSLSPYAGSLKPRQKDLVQAAMNVSLVNARNVSVWAAGLKIRSVKMSEREKAALEDCIQNFEDTTDDINRSLAEMKHLRRKTFDAQMDDVLTWMSGALTNEDTCLDGFQEVNATGEVTTMVTVRVQTVSEFISNALALLNTFAATGGGYSIDV